MGLGNFNLELHRVFSDHERKRLVDRGRELIGNSTGDHIPFFGNLIGNALSYLVPGSGILRTFFNSWNTKNLKNHFLYDKDYISHQIMTVCAKNRDIQVMPSITSDELIKLKKKMWLISIHLFNSWKSIQSLDQRMKTSWQDSWYARFRILKW